MRGIGAVFVRANTVVAQATDGTCEGFVTSSKNCAGRRDNVHPLGHAILRGIEQVAAHERQLKENKRHQAGRAELGRSDTSMAWGANSGLLDGDSVASSNSGTPCDDKSGPDSHEHLCHGCDVYVTLEPWCAFHLPLQCS